MSWCYAPIVAGVFLALVVWALAVMTGALESDE